VAPYHASISAERRAYVVELRKIGNTLAKLEAFSDHDE